MSHHVTEAGAQPPLPPVPPIPSMEAPPPPTLAAQPAPQPAPPPTSQPNFPTTARPPEWGPPSDNPPQMLEFTSMVLVFVGVIVLGTPLVRAFVRRFDRKTEAIRGGGSDIAPQLRQLQDSVDAMAIEIERISEGQRFTSKLMAERVGAAPRLEGESRG